MNAELLAMLTPEERAAWALCEGATPGPWVDMTSAGPDVGAFDGEIRAALSFAHICSDVPGDDRENDRAFIAGSRDALPAALTTIATLRAEHVAYRANADDLFQEMRVRGEALQRDLRDAESAASVEASEADRLRAELRAVADLIQEVGVLGIASTMDAVVVSGQPSARDLLTWAAKAMDTWPEERQVLRAEVATLRETLAEQQRAFVIGLDLAQRTAFTEADPVPARRNCRSCTHATGDHLGRPMCGVEEGEYDVAEWRADLANVDDDGHCRPDADNCPGYTLRESAARITANSP